MKQSFNITHRLIAYAITIFSFSFSSAQCVIDGTWSSTSGSTYYVYYDKVNDIIGAINVKHGYFFIYEYSGKNPYDGNNGYICSWSSSGQGENNYLEIFDQSTIGLVNSTGSYIWKKQYNSWYSTPSAQYYNYSWNPYSFTRLNPNANIAPIPSKPKYVNVTNPKTNPKNDVVPSPHTNPKGNVPSPKSHPRGK